MRSNPQRTDMTLDVFVKVKKSYTLSKPDKNGNVVGTRVVEDRAACPYMDGVLVASDKCYACPHNARRHYDERRPPWTVECRLHGA